jgi:hypothetical protein
VYWPPTPFASFPITSPPVRHRVPSHFNRSLILPLSGTGLQHLLPSCFCFVLLFIFVVVLTIFTHLFFVLVFYLLPLSVAPALYSSIQSGVPRLCTWYFNHAIAPGYDFPFCCFLLDYPIIDQILSFLPPTLLMSVFPFVALSHLLEFLLPRSDSGQLHYHSPLHPTTCNNPTG